MEVKTTCKKMEENPTKMYSVWSQEEDKFRNSGLAKHNAIVGSLILSSPPPE